MPNKINHKKRILSEQMVSKMAVIPHDLISFKYNVEDNFDKNPLVYILPAKDKERKISQKMKTHIYGLNLNYLREYVVQEFFKETGIIGKNPQYVILKKFNLYKKAFRTYIIDEMMGVKLVEYKKDIEVAEFKKMLKFMNPKELNEFELDLKDSAKDKIEMIIEERKARGIKK